MYTLLMRVGPFALTLTLVLTCAFRSYAATSTSAPELSTSEDQQPEQESSANIEGVTITQPPPLTARAKTTSTEIFFPYQSSVSPRAGVGSHTRRPTNEPYFYFVGLNLMFDSPNNRHIEVGVDLTSESHGLLHIGHKWVFQHNSAFRPYFKIGPTVALVPNEQLGTFLKYENYQARVAGGFEKLLKVPMSLRFDLEAALCSGRAEFATALGYSWAW
ncbi:MAG: hypothetical protein ABL958_00150 [Bdellovibrionia bacterium]